MTEAYVRLSCSDLQNKRRGTTLELGRIGVLIFSAGRPCLVVFWGPWRHWYDQMGGDARAEIGNYCSFAEVDGQGILVNNVTVYVTDNTQHSDQHCASMMLSEPCIAL